MRYSYTKALKMLTEWAIKQGYTDISFDYHDISYIAWESDSYNIPMEIKIEAKHPIELKVYVLLHELGHHQLRKDWGKFKKTLPVTEHAERNNIKKNIKKFERRLVYKVSCMEEEFKAWEEGYKLGVKLGVRVNLKKWNAFKAKCLMSYMRNYSSL